jgi:prephenate dehydrogenase
MAVQITILGLGPLGVSMGLALAPAKDQVTRLGSDASTDAMRQAQKNGAFDRTTINLPEAVRQADAVVLCLPLGELRKTMEGIRQDLKPGVVVLDTSPVPLQTTAWAQELFPTQNCYFLSFTPAVNPAYLFEGAGVEAAPHADYFKGGAIFIAHPQGIDPSAIEFSENLARLLGGSPVFSEAHEVEGLLALTRWLPLLSSAAVQGVAVAQPGWKEARRLAGADYAFAGLSLDACQGDAEPGLGLLKSKENSLRMLDLLSGELDALRALIAADQVDAFNQRLDQVRRGRETWLRQRQQANWEEESQKRPALPNIGESLGRLVGIRPRSERPDRGERKTR